MKNSLYVIYAIVLAAISIYTREIVTFIMLGFILLTLNNILKILIKILDVVSKK
jgi:hypothetical protein